MLQKGLFVKHCLRENDPVSFNDKFRPSKLPLNHTRRSSSSYQLKVNNFKPQMRKCALDWSNLQKIFKKNFQIMKRSNLKTNSKNCFLKQ